MKGRKPLPTAVKSQRGTLQKCRTKPDEMKPISISILEPPATLNSRGAKEWNIVTTNLQALGMLSAFDLSILEAYCREFESYFECMDKLGENRTITYKNPDGSLKAVKAHPLLQIANQHLDKALKIATEFGFTPSSRTRISMAALSSEKEYDEFDI